MKKNCFIKFFVSLGLFLINTTSCFSSVEKTSYETIVDNSIDTNARNSTNIFESISHNTYGNTNIYTVDFMTYGYGDYYSISKKEVKEGTKVEPLQNLTKTGYEFGGWFFEKECINEFDFDYPIYKNYVLYAKWTGSYEYKENDDGTLTLSGLNSDSYLNGNLVLPDQYMSKEITKIGNDVFKYVKGISSITLPNTITEIGENAFLGCSNIKTLVLSKGLKKVGSDAFYGCDNIDNIYYPDTFIKYLNISFASSNFYNSYYYLTNICEHFYFRENRSGAEYESDSSAYEYYELDYFVIDQDSEIRKLGNYALYGLKSLKRVVISNPSFSSIGNYSFANCINLEYVEFSSDFKNPVTIGNSAFENCISLTTFLQLSSESIVIRELGERTFYNCVSLKSDENYIFYNNILVEDSNIRKIPNYCFYNCKSLTTITIPNSCCWVCSNAFASCTNLSEVTLGTHTKRVYAYAFYNCPSISRVVFPTKDYDEVSASQYYLYQSEGNTNLLNAPNKEYTTK